MNIYKDILQMNNIRTEKSQYEKYINKLTGDDEEVFLYFKSKESLLEVLKKASLNFGVFPFINFDEDYNDFSFSKYKDLDECDDEEKECIKFQYVHIEKYHNLCSMNIKLINNIKNHALLYSIFESIKTLSEQNE
jgi:hypothetical protein